MYIDKSKNENQENEYSFHALTQKDMSILRSVLSLYINSVKSELIRVKNIADEIDIIEMESRKTIAMQFKTSIAESLKSKTW